MRKSTVLALIVAVILAGAGAIALFTTAQSKSETVSDDLLVRAETLRQAEDFDGTLAVLDEITAADPDNVEARVRRAEILSRDPDRRDEARELVGEVSRAELSEAGRAQAVSLFLRLEDEDRAREMLGPVRQDQPLSGPLSLAQAKIALQLDRDLAAARIALENVLRVEPDHIEAKQLLARLLFQVGSVLDQIRAKSFARELDEVDRLPLSLLGRMLFSEDSPLFRDEIVYFGERLLSHPDFEKSGFYNNLEFYRVMARRFKSTGRMDLAFEMEKARRNHPDATELDLLSYLDVALQTGRMNLVKRDLDELQNRVTDRIRYRVDIFRAAVASLEGDDDEALSLVKEAMTKGEEPGRVLVESIRYIGAAKRFSPQLELALSQLLLETDGIAIADVLIAANTVINSAETDAEKGAVVAEMTSRFENEPAVLATWLRTQGLAEESLAQAERVLAGGNVRVLPLVIDLNCMLGQVERAEKAFRDHGGKLDRFQRDIMAVRIAMAREDMAEAGDIWDGAWGRAQRDEDYRRMIALCHMAFAMSDYHRVMRSYDPLISNGIGLKLEEFLFLSGQEITRGRPDAARRILEQASVFFPDNRNLVNDRCYLSILLGEGDYRIIDTMEDLVKKEPENNYFRFTLALAYLVNEFRMEAMEIIEEIDFKASEFPHASRAIYAAVLWSNGHQGPAQLVLNQLDRDALLESERKTLEPFLGQL